MSSNLFTIYISHAWYFGKYYCWNWTQEQIYWIISMIYKNIFNMWSRVTSYITMVETFLWHYRNYYTQNCFHMRTNRKIARRISVCWLECGNISSSWKKSTSKKEKGENIKDVNNSYLFYPTSCYFHPRRQYVSNRKGVYGKIFKENNIK